MKKLFILILLITITLSYSKAQVGDLFSPMQGVPACQTAEPDKDFVAIMTAYTGDGQVNFDFDEFKSSMWIYFMRSKTEPFTYSFYGVISMLGQYTPIPAGIEEDSTMSYLKKLDLDAMVYKDKSVTEKLKLNPDYLAFIAANPSISQVIVILLKTDELDLGVAFPASFKNTESWVFNFEDKMICFVNAINGDTYCVDMISPVNETQIEAAIALYPNPANDLINISIDNESPDETIVTIFDAYGRELITNSSHEQTLSIPVSTLSAGTYFVEINTGGKIMRNKFTKI